GLLRLERAPHAPARTLVVRHAQQVLAESRDRARGRPDEAAEHVEEGGLAGAVRPDQPAGARLELNGHPVERGDAAEAHGEVVDVDHLARSLAGTTFRTSPYSSPPSLFMSRGNW